eukprot:10984544-Karenia_brevis.AAC.1
MRKRGLRNAAISVWEKIGHGRHVAPTFRKMRRANSSCDVRSFNAAISACEKGGQWQRVAPLFDQMRKKGISQHIASLSAATGSRENIGKRALAT